MSGAVIRRSRRRRWVAGGIGVTVAATAAATGGLLLSDVAGPAARPAAASTGLQTFDDCQALDEWYTAKLLPQVTEYGMSGPVSSRGGGPAVEDGVVASQAEAEAAAPAPATDRSSGVDEGSAVGVGGTGTNLQEAGVDEPDLAKTAGGVLYTLHNGYLVVLDVTGAGPRELGRVRLPEAPLEGELLLAGDRVVVLSTSTLAVEPAPGSHWDEPSMGDGAVAPAEPTPMTAPAPDIAPGSGGGMYLPGPPPGRTTTVTTVVDVADPSTPKLVSTDEIEGGYVSARLTGGTVRVVSTSTPQLTFPSMEPGATPSESANKEYVKDLSAQDFLPGTVVTDADGARSLKRPTDCSTVAHPDQWSGSGVITVRTLDPTRTDPVVDTDQVIADGDLVYASTDRLYVGTAGWAGWTGQVAGSTQLHAFDTSAEDETGYLVSGTAPGIVPGRWAMSARDGMLRVASTKQSRRSLTGRWLPSESGVTVFTEGEDDLEQIGTVGGLGVDEQIHAVRWFDETAYVVTFRQTDPLYAIDLGDPKAPRVTGELKIPGFSSYLHPVGGHRLLGVGQDADENTGRSGAAQVSLFDVADPAAPQRLALWQDAPTVWGSSRSAVADDSRQFSYLPQERIALVPIDGEGSSLVALRVEEKALTQTGRLVLGDWSQGSGEQLRRAISIGDGRVVLIQDGPTRTLTTVAADTLAASGTLALPPA